MKDEDINKIEEQIYAKPNRDIVDGVYLVALEYSRDSTIWWFIKMFAFVFGVILTLIGISIIFPQTYTITSLVGIFFSAGIVVYVLWVSGLLPPLKESNGGS